MKTKIFALTFAGALAIAAAVPAFANNGATTDKFVATYTNVADWTCSGKHVVNKNHNKDVETCLLSGNTSLVVAGTYTGNPTGNLPGWGPTTSWYSDNGSGALATSWTIVITDNGNGTFTARLNAIYPN